MSQNNPTVGVDDIVASLAVTLDGYVAREDGGVDYLEKYPITEFDFDAFLEGVGAIIMGRASYVQAVEWGWQWSAYPTMVLQAAPISRFPTEPTCSSRRRRRPKRSQHSERRPRKGFGCSVVAG